MAYEDMLAIANNKNILHKLYSELQSANVVAGEAEAVMLTYLAAQTRRFDPQFSNFRPVGLTAYGQSSSGKTYTQDLALNTVPDDHVVRITGMSDKVLTRKKTEDFAGKVVVLGEAEAMKSADVAYYLRKLFDDGHLTYEVLEESIDDFGQRSMRPHRYELGPGAWFSLMTSTTKQIHAENATRQLTVYSDDSDEQTRQVVRLMARNATHGGGMSYQAWKEFDAWQCDQEWGQVEIPFAGWIAKHVNISGPSLRRTFNSILSLIAAHALLHRNSRPTSETGLVRATKEDYEMVRSLVEPFLAREAMVKVPKSLEEVVSAVTKLSDKSEHGVSINQITNKVSVSRQTVQRRLIEAVDAGLLAKYGSQPSRYFPVDGLVASDGMHHILPPSETR